MWTFSGNKEPNALDPKQSGRLKGHIVDTRRQHVKLFILLTSKI